MENHHLNTRLSSWGYHHVFHQWVMASTASITRCYIIYPYLGVWANEHNWAGAFPSYLFELAVHQQRLRKTTSHISAWSKVSLWASKVFTETSHQSDFQDPKMKVLYHFWPYLVGIFPHIVDTCSLGSWNDHKNQRFLNHAQDRDPASRNICSSAKNQIYFDDETRKQNIYPLVN